MRGNSFASMGSQCTGIGAKRRFMFEANGDEDRDAALCGMLDHASVAATLNFPLTELVDDQEICAILQPARRKLYSGDK